MTRTPLYRGLTREASVFGISVYYWLTTFIVGVMTLQFAKSPLMALLVTGVAMAVFRYAAWRGPNFFRMLYLGWIRTARQRNWPHWQGNAYEPW